jgi:1-acyl-sn-glycerol-3-phosphate acyltransferase
MRRLIPRLWARATGFTVHPPEMPIPAKCVVIAYPHTTNWDFPACLYVSDQSGVSIKWLGKQQLFRGPMGPVMRALGGVSVARGTKQGLVAELAEEFRRADRLAVVVPAEGTRSKVEYWKSGFYRIALAAEVPIVCAYVDGSTNTGGFGLVLQPTGDVKADMDKIRAFYAGRTGLKPGNTSTPRLREEVSPDASDTDASLTTDGGSQSAP